MVKKLCRSVGNYTSVWRTKIRVKVWALGMKLNSIKVEENKRSRAATNGKEGQTKQFRPIGACLAAKKAQTGRHKLRKQMF